ncbi:hypothetical protein CEXT_17001 [Caerostris extrusa]|uniref:Uncharacterized protein n=1 Tax=Caerostris extrusa TaxID=172846 RepID=A0AAV4RYU5_CAEEX|nr:hypothetical protein CEXT_17001 [Caerostris extrusa]
MLTGNLSSTNRSSRFAQNNAHGKSATHALEPSLRNIRPARSTSIILRTSGPSSSSGKSDKFIWYRSGIEQLQLTSSFSMSNIFFEGVL